MSIREETKPWPTANRFIAFLDIVGFKDFVSRNKHSHVKSVIYKLHQMVEESKVNKLTINENMVKQGEQDISVVGLIKPLIKTFMFSDSILLVSIDDSYYSELLIVMRVNNLIYNSLKLEEPLPLKGSIAYGEITADWDKRIFLGQPIIDAYLLQEELAFYGAVYHHTAEKYSNSISKPTDFHDEIERCEYMVPFKKNKSNHIIANWKSLIKSEEELFTIIRNLKYRTSGGLRYEIDNTEKYLKEIINT